MTVSLESIARFMEEGGQTVPEHSDLDIRFMDIAKFIQRVQEEVKETIEAAHPAKPDELLDGFLDIAYAAFTGAIRVGGLEAAQEAWDAIEDANLAKIDGRYGEVVRDKASGKILKPEGWEAPDIQGILEKHAKQEEAEQVDETDQLEQGGRSDGQDGLGPSDG